MRRLLFGFLQVLFCCQTLIFSENLCFSLFLTAWKSEVIVMSIFEYDEKREKKKLLQTELPISKEEAKAIFQRYPLNLVTPPVSPRSEKRSE